MLKSQLARCEPADGLDAYVTSTKERTCSPTIWEPTTVAKRNAVPLAIPIERELIDLIMAPLSPGERHREGHDRKESELAAMLDLLTAVQSLALAKRIENAVADDPLVAAFERLAVHRRVRLLAYLARRRSIAAAIAQRNAR
jgi:hypothetical protein